ncbi:MAG: tyrosine-type recombinase/integrase [Hungatella hathewayi]|nr:tyrosine-type recombinase/integrase [Hungatella hathewayi]
MRKRKNVIDVTERQLEEYEEYLEDEERSRATVEKYLRDIRKFRSFIQMDGTGEETEDAIGEKSERLGKTQKSEKEWIREYKQYLKEHYKTTSANSMLAALNSYVSFLGRDDLKVKFFRIQHVQYSQPEKELTEQDYKCLIQAAEKRGDIRMKMLLQTIGSTGIRISELRFITVESLEDGRTDIYNKGKSRIALLPDALVRLLKNYCRKMGIRGGSIFVTKSGRPMDRSNINKKMKELGREAGVDERKVFPHNLRHLFARTFYRIEKDVVRLMDLLGHSSINTTRIYTMTTEAQPKKTLARMRLVFG